MQGFKLSPRIRDLADHCLYPLTSVTDYGVLKPLFRGPTIRRDLIVRCWDDMHRISASLKDGTVTAVLLTSKLQALDNKNLIHRGLEEYGRMLSTIDMLTFIRIRSQSPNVSLKEESQNTLKWHILERTLQVASTGYSVWRKREPSQRQRETAV